MCLAPFWALAIRYGGLTSHPLHLLPIRAGAYFHAERHSELEGAFHHRPHYADPKGLLTPPALPLCERG